MESAAVMHRTLFSNSQFSLYSFIFISFALSLEDNLIVYERICDFGGKG